MNAINSVLKTSVYGSRKIWYTSRIMSQNTIRIAPAACTGLAPETVLKSVFGYSSFRPLQKEIIENVCAGKDTLAIMPTGGGKSLTYQIPALIFDGLTVVVSPLIALMQDQVSSLVSNGVEAVFLNSSLDWENYRGAVARIISGQIKIVYVSPEGLATQRIQDILHNENVKVKCFTIDEAHCISEWGHDFRPDYLGIAAVRRQFPEAVCLALTATATKQVREDIAKNLQLESPQVLVASFNRPNIFLEVRPKRDSYSQIVQFLNERKEDSGIIYCFSRKQVDQLADMLSNDGFSVLPYHAGLDDVTRAGNQTAFIRDKVQIMVATVAFGMGIDKPNVRFVIHYDLPKSLEQYYQEIGRAGRDGLPSSALLLYSSSDIHKIRYFFDESADSEKAERLLQKMVSYASSRTCRRKTLLSYFGEPFVSTDKNCCCDVCSADPVAETDVTIPVQKFLSCIYRVNQRFGTSYVIDVLLGSRQKRIMDNGHNMLSTWGIGTDLSREDWFELAEILLDRGFIAKSVEYSVVSVTEKGREVLATREKIFLPIELSGKGSGGLKFEKPGHGKNAKPGFTLHKKGSALAAIDESDSEGLRICSELKEWRRKTADEENVPPYVIFGDKTLVEIAVRKPKVMASLLEVYGIGEAKARKFGSSILRIVKG